MYDGLTLCWCCLCAGVVCTYHSPLTYKFTNLFKNTNLNITFLTINTICKQLCDRMPQNKINSRGIYKLKCKTCNNSYVGQTGRWIGIGHRKHTRYIKTNNLISEYPLHMLNYKYDYRKADQTIQLLKSCNKGNKMNYWESF